MKTNKEKELCSLNEELPSFFVEELEQRLETDPLGISGLLNGEFLEDAECKIKGGDGCRFDCPGTFDCTEFNP